MNVVVQKFGGTSVGTIDRIRNVAKIIKDLSTSQKNIVVVSAMAGQTNKLVQMAYEMSANPQPQAYDMLLASGEQISASLLAMALESMGVKARALLAYQAGIETDELFTNARILNIKSEGLNQLVKDGIVPVIAGFQGVVKDSDQITTLGRGGSDTTAVAVAIAVKAHRCDIYTDVNGVYTADPRLVPNAKRIEKISFEEMMELASLGAKVLHMRSVELAAKYKMPLRVLSTFDPKDTGSTLMTTENINTESMESGVVSSITSDAAECLMHVKTKEEVARYPAKFFRPLADAGINVDVIVKTPPDNENHSTLSFTVPRLDGEKAVKLLSSHQVKIQESSVVKVSIVGIGMRTHSGVAALMFETLEKEKIPVLLVTTSEIKVSVLISEQHKDKAIQCLHNIFELGKN